MGSIQRRYEREGRPNSPRQGGDEAGGPRLSALQEQLVDDAILAYVEWREEQAAVWTAYGHWADALGVDAPLAHGAYTAALDREEAAARTYAAFMWRVNELAEAQLYDGGRGRPSSRG